MVFGPEIKVDGKRPEWLGDYKGPLGYSRGADSWYGPCEEDPDFWTEVDIVNGRGWNSVCAIRLPANHPHYQQNAPTPDERAVALVKRLASLSPDHLPRAFEFAPIQDEARAIVAALEPVDPDVLEARNIEAQICRRSDLEDEAQKVEKGELDDRPGMVGVLAAIKRGRQLEKEGK